MDVQWRVWVMGNGGDGEWMFSGRVWVMGIGGDGEWR